MLRNLKNDIPPPPGLSGYHGITDTMALWIPQGYGYHRDADTTGIQIQRGYGYHGDTDTTGIRIPQRYGYHGDTDTTADLLSHPGLLYSINIRLGRFFYVLKKSIFWRGIFLHFLLSSMFTHLKTICDCISSPIVLVLGLCPSMLIRVE